MSVSLNVSDFSADFFTLDQENKPTDVVQFLKGLHVLASRALDALSRPEDVELAFQRIESASLVELSSEDKKNTDQRIHDVFNQWVKVTFGSHSRHVPRERLVERCGPKFKAQYTSRMKEASDRKLDLKSADTDECPIDDCPEECKELILVYLQTGALPPGALGDNALNMLTLAEQHQLEGLIDECLGFLIDNLSIENLDTFLEFTEKAHCPWLEVACLNFMKTIRDSISEDLKTKYQEQLSTVEALERGEIALTISSSRKIEAEVTTFADQTADVLQRVSKQFPITSLIILVGGGEDILPSLLEQIAPTLKNLQELIIWDKTPTDSNLPELKNLFPNLTALGNDAPFLKTFDEVNTYVANFREPGEDDQESKKPLLRSLNLKNVPNLVDAQVAELAPYLQEIYHLFIKSDKITSVAALKATWVDCCDCTALTTLEAPRATQVDCNDCTVLTTLEAPKAATVFCDRCTKLTTIKAPESNEVHCSNCTALTTLEAPQATEVFCDGCMRLTTLQAPEATSVDCQNCTALTALITPEATKVNCSDCTSLTTLEAPEVTKVYCRGCTELTTLRTPEATTVNCNDCTELTTLEAPKATSVYCRNCTALTTLKAPEATSVDCRDCTKLNTLEVPEAIEVVCYDCTTLTTLEAPKATEVDCNGCTALTTLKAPESTEVDCIDCTALTTLEAPKATEVNCSRCTQLRTLTSPLATSVRSDGCTALTTPNRSHCNLL